MNAPDWLGQVGLKVQHAADNVVTRSIGTSPRVIEKDGEKIAVIHSRVGSPRTGRWIEFDNGMFALAKSNDVVHVYRSGRLVERETVKSTPKGTSVYGEGESIFELRNGQLVERSEE